MKLILRILFVVESALAFAIISGSGYSLFDHSGEGFEALSDFLLFLMVGLIAGFIMSLMSLKYLNDQLLKKLCLIMGISLAIIFVILFISSN